MICTIKQICRVCYTRNRVEERPWHVGDEVICEMTFRVNKRHGRAYQEVVVRDIELLSDLYTFV